jgi:glycerophosphoryl diester phosphodiesterase
MKSRRPQYGYMDNNGEIIALAHAGGNLAGPDKQGTMAAFEAAYNIGFRYAEADLIVSADNKLVICHGARTPRQARKTKRPLRSWLQSMTYPEITQAVTAGGEALPLLEEVLSSFPGMKFNLELKTSEAAEPLGRFLGKHVDIDRFCIASFCYAYTKGAVDVIREYRWQKTPVCTAAGPLGIIAAKAGLTGYLESAEFAYLQSPYKATYLHTSAKMIEQSHDAGVQVHVWTVNEAADMLDAIAMGVDGILTDEIELLQSVVGQQG